MKLILCLFAVLLASVEAIVCPPNICTLIKCSTVASCDGHVNQKGGFCGCCPICVHHLGEGEKCINMLLLGSVHDRECGPGLYCDHNTMLCKKQSFNAFVSCLTKRKQALESHLLGTFVPVCDPDGNYSAVQCHGSKCYCANKDGSHINGYQGNRDENINCRCARDMAEYMKTGLIGKMFRCDSNGSYNKVQCLGSSCYCVDEFGKTTNGISVHITEASKLKCK